MNHSEGAAHTKQDDYYNVSSGTKEIYYLSEIESANHIVKYQLTQRLDGRDAANIVNGATNNTHISDIPTVANQGSNYLFRWPYVDHQN